MTTLAPGQLLGDYVVVSLLGAGAFAQVYRAQSPGGREVAIKVSRGDKIPFAQHEARIAHLQGSLAKLQETAPTPKTCPRPSNGRGFALQLRSRKRF